MIPGDYLLTLGLLIIFLILFAITGFLGWYRLSRKKGQVDQALNIIRRNDPIWEIDYLKISAKHVFEIVSLAFSGKNRKTLNQYLTTELLLEKCDILDKMDEVGQNFVIENLEIKDVQIVDLEDKTDDLQDKFTARIKYESVNYTTDMDDEICEPKWSVDIDTNKKKKPVENLEFWSYKRKGMKWVVSKIDKEWKEGDYTEHKPVLDDRKYN